MPLLECRDFRRRDRHGHLVLVRDRRHDDRDPARRLGSGRCRRLRSSRPRLPLLRSPARRPKMPPSSSAPLSSFFGLPSSCSLRAASGHALASLTAPAVIAASGLASNVIVAAVARRHHGRGGQLLRLDLLADLVDPILECRDATRTARSAPAVSLVALHQLRQEVAEAGRVVAGLVGQPRRRSRRLRSRRCGRTRCRGCCRRRCVGERADILAAARLPTSVPSFDLLALLDRVDRVLLR